MHRWLSLTVLLPACQQQVGPPAWAVDPIWLEAGPSDTLLGFQTWTLYDAGWQRRYADRHYVCAVIVGLDGGAEAPCPECVVSWAVQTRVVETDCPEEVDQARFLTLSHVGLGDVVPRADVPNAEPTAAAPVWADYGDGWEPYGWGWPTETAPSGTAAAWDGTQPYTLLPTLVWDLAR